MVYIGLVTGFEKISRQDPNRALDEA
jgi:hypothetical protein